MVEFQKWPSIARLNRGMVITEKIDGTNAAIIISEPNPNFGEYPLIVKGPDDNRYGLAAQSRKRLITPDSDNFGFAAWAFENAEILVDHLGTGRHFGEWWGSGIQRGYGLSKGEKRFSLFNVHKWKGVNYLPGTFSDLPELCVVPTLSTYNFDTNKIRETMAKLQIEGSMASPGFMNPEGIVVFHTVASALFKVTFEGDELGKWSISEQSN